MKQQKVLSIGLFAALLTLCSVPGLFLAGCGGSEEGTTVTATHSPEVELASIEQAVANSGAAWTPALNPIAQMPVAQQDMLLGAQLESDDGLARETGREAAARQAAQALPAALDWRAKDGANWLSPIRDQGSGCNSCTTFATIGATEALTRIAYNNAGMSMDLSEADLYSCSNHVCANLWLISEASSRLRDTGAVDEACLPYGVSNSNLQNTCEDMCADAVSRTTRIASWNHVQRYNNHDNTIASIKTALQDGPLVGGIKVYTDLFYYSSGVYDYAYGDDRGGHAVAIVGYNDEGGYWIVRNSWGTGWGESGYFKLKYYARGGIEASSIFRLVVNDPPAVTVTASASPASATLSGGSAQATLTCTAAGGAATSLEGRCNTTGAWTAIASGATMACTYTAAGSYTPGCRVNGSATDDVNTAVVIAAGAACGDSAVDTGEQCDSGASNGTACTAAYGSSCTYCSASCQNVTLQGASCGDSSVDAGNSEQCDSGASNGTACTAAYGSSCTYCSASCQSVTVQGGSCGDGTTNTANAEQCDSGANNGTTCTAAYGSSCSYCSASCQNVTVQGASCGDGILNAGNGEQCDDSNTGSGDGCSSTCQTEADCGVNVDSVACEAVSGCHWNFGALYCHAPCDVIADETSCVASQYCLWAPGSGCSDRTPAGMTCAFQPDQPSCESQPLAAQCLWVGTCVDQCSAYNGNQVNCEANATCYWRSSESVCMTW